MNKQLFMITLTMLNVFCLTQNARAMLGGEGSERQYYRIVKITAGTELPSGKTVIGYVPGSVCNIVERNELDAAKCAVITATPPKGFQEGPGIKPGTLTFYYLKETNRGILQPNNFVAYVEQEKVKPGAKTIGIYKANNY